LQEAAKYAVLSMDATIRSNVTVGAPVDLMIYEADSFTIHHQRRFQENDRDLSEIHALWEQGLRAIVADLPEIEFGDEKVSYYVQRKRAALQAELDLSH
jgi:putative proteasome-type protease